MVFVGVSAVVRIFRRTELRLGRRWSIPSAYQRELARFVEE
jgi:hypothetical protein